MAGLPANEPFLLELRYTMEGSYAELPLPSFPEDPAVQKVYVAAFIPEEQLVLATRGPWTKSLAGRGATACSGCQTRINRSTL